MEKLFIFLVIGLCIQILAIMTTSASTGASKYRSGFGESCNKTMRCKSQSWLVCNPETYQCTCAKPDQMIYDNDREECVAMIGERCRYSFGSDVESARLFYENVDCVGGAICGNEDAICACSIGTYEAMEENKCLPVKSRGANCQLSTECNKTASLICLDGKCECANDDMLFDDIKGSCRIKAGKTCNAYHLLEYPIIIRKGSSHNEFDCVNRSQCMLNSGICTCVAGMYMSSGNCLPLKGLESHCGSSEECDGSQMLTCINRRCECDPTKATKTLSSHTVLYSGYSQARSEGEGMKVNSQGPAFFGARFSNLQKGHSITNVKYFKKISGPGFSLHGPGYSSIYYRVPAGICVGKVGTSCSEMQYQGDYITVPAVSGIHCIRNGFCTMDSICECTNGYSQTNDGLCGLGYGQKCSEVDPCNDKFTCTQPDPSNTECRCPSEELQIYVDNECKGVVGGPCEPIIGCVENARCIETTEPNAKGSICECQEGFIEFDAHNCDIVYGLKCDPTSREGHCDRKSGLICTKKPGDSEFRCNCPNAHDVFESTLHKCSRAVGYRCLRDNDCVRNASCFKRREASSGRCTCKSGFLISNENRMCFLDPIDLSYETTAYIEEGDLDAGNKTKVSPQG